MRDLKTYQTSFLHFYKSFQKYTLQCTCYHASDVQKLLVSPLPSQTLQQTKTHCSKTFSATMWAYGLGSDGYLRVLSGISELPFLHDVTLVNSHHLFGFLTFKRKRMERHTYIKLLVHQLTSGWQLRSKCRIPFLSFPWTGPTGLLLKIACKN